MSPFRTSVLLVGLSTLVCYASKASSSTISHTATASPGAMVLVNGGFTYTLGTNPSVKGEYGTYPGGVFTPLNPAVTRAGAINIVNPPTGTFSTNPPYQGTAGVQVAFKSTLYETTFFWNKTEVAHSVGTITP